MARTRAPRAVPFSVLLDEPLGGQGAAVKDKDGFDAQMTKLAGPVNAEPHKAVAPLRPVSSGQSMYMCVSGRG